MKKFVLFDVNYLAYRAFYSTGSLSHEGDATGVVYGVLKEIQATRSRFADAKLVFCFDHAKGMRELIYPGYKATRRNKRATEEEAAALDGLRAQVTNLKFKYLERAGFNNVFFQSGYEADDIIAALSIRLREQAEVTVVSDDKDLYQLLHDNVSMWKPRSQTLYTLRNFTKDYGIEPEQWAKVKAIAGCSSDDVAGVPGVGEGFALKYVRGELKTTSAKYKAIKEAKALWKANLPIVKLPLAIDGTVQLKTFKIVKDRTTPEKWDELAESLGIVTLSASMPPAINRKPLLARK